MRLECLRYGAPRERLHFGECIVTISALALSGCKGSVAAGAPLSEVLVINVKPRSVKDYNEYLAQTQPAAGAVAIAETFPGEWPELGPAFHIRLTDGTDCALPGKLNFFDARLDQKIGLQVRISVPNPDRVLRTVLFGRVTVPAFENPKAIRIPRQAVQELQGMKSVYVIAPDDKAEPG
jgi:hypothetical protein